MTRTEYIVLRTIQILLFLLWEGTVLWALFGFSHRPANVDWLTLYSVYTNKLGLWGVIGCLSMLALPMRMYFQKEKGYTEAGIGVGTCLAMLSLLAAWCPFPYIRFLHLPVVLGLVLRIGAIYYLSRILYWFQFTKWGHPKSER